jgi:predicted ATP-dependent serine protease
MHFDGPMIAGGHPYELDDLLNAEAPPMLPTGIVALDDFTGGIERGSLWAISGLAGIGVSGLALALAANAASDGDVIVCNGHIPSRVLARRLATLAGNERRLRVASWFSLLPEPPDGLGDGTLEQADLVVVDTWTRRGMPQRGRALVPSSPAGFAGSDISRATTAPPSF